MSLAKYILLELDIVGTCLAMYLARSTDVVCNICMTIMNKNDVFKCATIISLHIYISPVIQLVKKHSQKTQESTQELQRTIHRQQSKEHKI